MNPIIIGNITNVKWHYVLKKIYGTWGHSREIYSDDYDIDDTMYADKYYAYIYIKSINNKNNNNNINNINNNKLIVRNTFDSNDPKGFDQKNTYFPDEFYESSILQIENRDNKLAEYIQRGYGTGNELYFCVEYTLTKGV